MQPSPAFDLFARIDPAPGPGARVTRLWGRADLLDVPLGPVAGGAIRISPEGRLSWRAEAPRAALPPGALDITIEDPGGARRTLSLALTLGAAPCRFGALTPEGCGGQATGAVRIMGGDRRGHWRLDRGILIPTGAPLDPGGYLIETDIGPIPVAVAGGAATASGPGELARLAAAGLPRIELRPGDYGSPELPRSLRALTAADPAAPPRLGPLVVPRGAGPLALEDLHIAALRGDLLANRPRAHVFLIDAEGAEGLAIRRCRLSGDMGRARDGAPDSPRLSGIRAEGRAIAIAECRFEGLVNAMRLAGRDIAVTGNAGRRNWGDFVILTPMADGADSADIRIAGNSHGEMSGNGRLIHSDFLQVYSPPDAARRGTVHRVTVEGNIAFLGHEGVRQPPVIPFPASRDRPAVTGSRALGPEDDRALLPVDAGGGPVRLTLPAQHRAADGRPLRLAVQKTDPGPHAVEIALPGGTPPVRLAARWQAAILDAPPGPDGAWSARAAKPAAQGIFIARLDPDRPAEDWVVRGNVFWLNSPHGISAAVPMARARIHGNSLLQPFPGDVNGDGAANAPGDGVAEFTTMRIAVSGPEVEIRDNICGAAGPSLDRATRNRWPEPRLSGNLEGAHRAERLAALLGRPAPHPLSAAQAAAAAIPAEPLPAGAARSPAFDEDPPE